MKLKEIVVILGSPNSPSGELSEISKSRLNYCIGYFKADDLVICTGGWGDHFNISKDAHASFAKSYLIENGLLESCFLDAALSSNTVDDAVKIKPIISELKNIRITIITSDYHLDRVKIIFNEILDEYSMDFIGVESNLGEDEYNELVLHEKNAISEIVKNGLYY